MGYYGYGRSPWKKFRNAVLMIAGGAAGLAGFYRFGMVKKDTVHVNSIETVNGERLIRTNKGLFHNENGGLSFKFGGASKNIDDMLQPGGDYEISYYNRIHDGANILSAEIAPNPNAVTAAPDQTTKSNNAPIIGETRYINEGKGPGYPLRKEEAALIKSLFGDEINTDNVRLFFYSATKPNNPAATKADMQPQPDGSTDVEQRVEFYGVRYASQNYALDIPENFGIFCHEMTHVMQGQKLFTQVNDAHNCYGYNITDKTKFADLGPEEQASLIQDYSRRFLHPDHPPSFLWTPAGSMQTVDMSGRDVTAKHDTPESDAKIIRVVETRFPKAAIARKAVAAGQKIAAPPAAPQLTYNDGSTALLLMATRFIKTNENRQNILLSSYLTNYAHVGPWNPARYDQPWCAAYINAVLGECQIKGTGSAAARSFLEEGVPQEKRRFQTVPAAQAKPGDFVIFRRNVSQGHVGLVIDRYFDKNEGIWRVKVLGGNQGDGNGGGVTVQIFTEENLLGYRRLSDADAKKAEKALKEFKMDSRYVADISKKAAAARLPDAFVNKFGFQIAPTVAPTVAVR